MIYPYYLKKTLDYGILKAGTILSISTGALIKFPCSLMARLVIGQTEFCSKIQPQYYNSKDGEIEVELTMVIPYESRVRFSTRRPLFVVEQIRFCWACQDSPNFSVTQRELEESLVLQSWDITIANEDNLAYEFRRVPFYLRSDLQYGMVNAGTILSFSTGVIIDVPCTKIVKIFPGIQDFRRKFQPKIYTFRDGPTEIEVTMTVLEQCNVTFLTKDPFFFLTIAKWCGHCNTVQEID